MGEDRLWPRLNLHLTLGALQSAFVHRRTTEVMHEVESMRRRRLTLATGKRKRAKQSEQNSLENGEGALNSACPPWQK